MKNLKLILLIVSFGELCFAQTLNWAKKIESAKGNIRANAVFVDDQNQEIFVAGEFSGMADFDPGPDTSLLNASGMLDGFIAKYDTAGNFFWVKGFKGTTVTVNDITKNVNGNLIITGVFYLQMDCDPGPNIHPITSTGGDMFIIALDTAGNYLWANHINFQYYGFGSSVVCDSSGAIYTTGIPAVIKLDSTGNIIDSINMANYFIGTGILYDPTGYIYLGGHFSGIYDIDPNQGTTILSAQDTSGFIAKYDLNFQLIWARNLVSVNGNSGIERIALSGNGSLFATGNFVSDCDFDAFGSHYVINSNGGWDGFLFHIDSSGNFIMAQALGGSGGDGISGLAVSDNGNVYISGSFEDSVDFDFGINQQIFYSADRAGFIAIYDSLGGYIFTGILNNNNRWADIYDLSVDQTNHIYGTGQFDGDIDFDLQSGTYILSTDTLHYSTPIVKYVDTY